MNRFFSRVHHAQIALAVYNFALEHGASHVHGPSPFDSGYLGDVEDR